MERKRTTQRLASIGARQVVSQSTMKFASDSPQFSYVKLTLITTDLILRSKYLWGWLW
ncbi:hypothetical protein [Leptospira noguchii]|uniref:hypothetical protein n=1 Tax=Leptospira noguchii TaxID=28182 RepID=UPI0002DBCB21|nr:hypothetical protein [Leptospira noguchii]